MSHCPNFSPWGMMPISPSLVAFAPFIPPTFDERATEDDQLRVTEDNQIRVVE